MKFNKILSYSALAVVTLSMLVGCEDDASTQNKTEKTFVSFQDMPLPADVTEGQTTTIEAKVYAGNTSNVDRVISLQVIFDSDYNSAHINPESGLPATVVPVTTADQDDFSVPASVTIPAGSNVGTFQVTLTDNDLGYNGKQIVIGIVPQAGIDQAMTNIGTATAGDLEVLNDRLIITARRECLLTSVYLEISTDSRGSETTWELYDSVFDVIANGGPYDDVAGSGGKTYFCLEDGSYTFVVYDSGEDGMGTDGSYRLVKIGEDGTETEIVSGGQFETDELTEFQIP